MRIVILSWTRILRESSLWIVSQDQSLRRSIFCNYVLWIVRTWAEIRSLNCCHTLINIGCSFVERTGVTFERRLIIIILRNLFCTALFNRACCRPCLFLIYTILSIFVLIVKGTYNTEARRTSHRFYYWCLLYRSFGATSHRVVNNFSVLLSSSNNIIVVVRSVQ